MGGDRAPLQTIMNLESLAPSAASLAVVGPPACGLCQTGAFPSAAIAPCVVWNTSPSSFPRDSTGDEHPTDPENGQLSPPFFWPGVHNRILLHIPFCPQRWTDDLCRFWLAPTAVGDDRSAPVDHESPGSSAFSSVFRQTLLRPTPVFGLYIQLLLLRVFSLTPLGSTHLVEHNTIMFSVICITHISTIAPTVLSSA
jgi:hypothetical protein